MSVMPETLQPQNEKKEIAKGDFTHLAKSYKNRVGYSKTVLRAIINQLGVKIENLKVAEVGAGTGKLTVQLVELGLNVIAVEPNDAMREEGISATAGMPVQWIKGSGENTNLPTSAFDWVIMASSFHWVDLNLGLKEFFRLLRPTGIFTALWNPRDLESCELQLRIDQSIKTIVPELKRFSSGGKSYSEDWAKKITSNGLFRDVLFMESRHRESLSRERYLGIWQSVNDIQAQAGPARWKAIVEMIERETKDHSVIEVPYLTRAWTAFKTSN